MWKRFWEWLGSHNYNRNMFMKEFEYGDDCWDCNDTDCKPSRCREMGKDIDKK